MRPLELEMQGFTCFREKTVVDFEGLDVFAITGRTGSGKTTIMDAMCFALYGRVPRGTDVSDLVARGVPSMHVALAFEAGGDRYRVTRAIAVNQRTAKAGATKVQLERQLTDGGWEPLEDRVREANTAIERTLGLDFDGFQRCVLLPQGRFHEMLTGDAKKRREVLEELLDAEIYGRIMTAANARGKLERERARAKQELLDSTFKDATEDALEATRLLLDDLRPRLAEAEATRDAAQQARQLAATLIATRRAERSKREELDALAEQITRAEKICETGEKQLARRAAEIGAAQEEVRATGYDAQLHQQLSAAEVVAKQTEKLSADAAAAQQRAADTASLEQAKRDEEAALVAHEQARAAMSEAERVLEEARVAHAAADLQRHLKPGDTCPVCGGRIGKLPRIAAGELARAEATVKKAKAAEQRAASVAAQASKDVALARQAQEAAAADAARLAKDLKGAERDLAQRLPPGIAATLAAIHARKSELDEAAVREQELRRRIEQLTSERERADRELAEAKTNITTLKASADSLGKQADADRAAGDAALTDLRVIVDRCGWRDVAALIDAKKDPSTALGTILQKAQEACDQHNRSIGQLEVRAKTIEAQIEQAKAHRAEMEEAAREAGLYEQLADLLKANNFRDWLISEAMSLLAEAASRRLETLDSERRYSLVVRNNEFCVVDHWDADSERGADTLSGGETFVVSLALALALAEQIPQIQEGARASLESLFLDEGFGTLDPDTLEPVIGAIDALRQEGRVVGIITHVSELAQRIERRIEVHKNQAGSTVTVV